MTQQEEYNEKGELAIKKLLEEYPQYEFMDMDNYYTYKKKQKGYELLISSHGIKTEVKFRGGSPTSSLADVSEKQAKNATILSVYEDGIIGWHCYMSDYLKSDKCEDSYGSKYKKMRMIHFMSIATKDLSSLIDPILSKPSQYGVERFFI